MRRVCIYLLSVLVLFTSGNSFAQNVPILTLPNQIPSPQDAISYITNNISQWTGGTLEVQDTTYFRLCEIRRFFCGKVKLVLVGVSVFGMGIMILTGKAKWIHAIILVTGIVIFTGAEFIAVQLTTFPPNLGVVYSCFCFESQIGIITNLITDITH